MSTRDKPKLATSKVYWPKLGHCGKTDSNGYLCGFGKKEDRFTGLMQSKLDFGKLDHKQVERFIERKKNMSIIPVKDIVLFGLSPLGFPSRM